MQQLILSFLALACSVSASARSQPNFVFIIADDLGWADVGFHGGNTPTPNLDQLLAEGIELKQHYVAPVCSPTRAGFLTGRYWSRFGITAPINNQGLSFETVTVAKALGEVGYSTALIGKWHLGSKSEWGPNHFGFDHSYGSLAGGIAPYNHRYKKGAYSVTWHRNHELLEEEGHATDLLTNEAVRWIDDAIDKAGQKENTLIVFTSDNGGSTDQNNDTKYPDDNCPKGKLTGNNLPLRGQKGSLYEGGIRVPTIARWPGKLKPGTEFETPVCVVAWMPTFCALAKAKTESAELKWDGVNLWPALTGEAKLAKRSLHIAGPGGNRWALRDGDWKLILTQPKDRDPAGKPELELFNLANDPNEKTELAARNPEKVQELKETLARQRKLDVPSPQKRIPSSELISRAAPLLTEAVANPISSDS